MLQDSKAFASFSVDDIPRAKAFYADTLGLRVRDEMGGLALDPAGGTTVFVYPKDDHAPAAFTVLNFPVTGLEGIVDRLTAAGVRFEQYPELGTNERGIARMEQGPTIAWFRDPAGNIFAVHEE
ncbi:VOC family protein [Ramlibacter sp.]|uniref:VOC family protein n=1 Tax=Ramlibacter sp. TaxID=1917967 RepID=UPI0017AC587A|nr:VOC family protein [Ramlibacter sp.]MBA2673050.1 VOC family protein [Ramlibacter sp.]